MRSSRRIFDTELLDYAIKKDNAELLTKYTKLNRESRIQFKCSCGNQHDKAFRRIVDSTGAFCEDCSYKNEVLKYKDTCLSKYGETNPLKNVDVRKRMNETISINRDKDNKYDTKIIQKRNNTWKEKYYNNDNALKNIVQKRKNTLLKRTGYEFALQNPKTKEIFQKTCINRYGVKYPIQRDDILQKQVNTMIEKYGVKYPILNTGIRDKMRQTTFKKYGVYHTSQSREIQEKIQYNAKKFKNYTMPNGEVRKIQGYENFALDELVKNYEPDDIITERYKIQRIPYTYDNIQKYYFPDIHIKSTNTIIEVKSTYTYQKDICRINLKGNACKSMGYNFEIWKYTNKGIKEIILIKDIPLTQE